MIRDLRSAHWRAARRRASRSLAFARGDIVGTGAGAARRRRRRVPIARSTIAVTSPRAITCKRGFASILASHLAARVRARGLDGVRRRHRPRIARRRRPVRRRRTDAARGRERPDRPRRPRAPDRDDPADRPAGRARAAHAPAAERARAAPAQQDDGAARTVARRVRLRRHRRAGRGRARHVRLGTHDAPAGRRSPRRGDRGGIRARRRAPLSERDRGRQEQRCAAVDVRRARRAHRSRRGRHAFSAHRARHRPQAARHPRHRVGTATLGPATAGDAARPRPARRAASASSPPSSTASPRTSRAGAHSDGSRRAVGQDTAHGTDQDRMAGFRTRRARRRLRPDPPARVRRSRGAGAARPPGRVRAARRERPAAGLGQERDRRLPLSRRRGLHRRRRRVQLRQRDHRRSARQRAAGPADQLVRDRAAAGRLLLPARQRRLRRRRRARRGVARSGKATNGSRC